MKYLTIAILAAVSIGSACADPAANKPKAQTTNSNTVTNAAPVDITAPPVDVLAGYKPAGTVYAITPENGKIEFTGSKVTGKHDGGFKTFSGIVDVVGNKVETSKVAFEVEMSSVFTDADGLTTHLQTPDFFDAAKYPKASFVSTTIAPGAEGSFNVTGELNMRGMKKTITFPAKIAISDSVVTVDTDFSVNRKDFGMAYAGKADDLIRDDVVIRLTIKANKK